MPILPPIGDFSSFATRTKTNGRTLLFRVSLATRLLTQVLVVFTSHLSSQGNTAVSLHGHSPESGISRNMETTPRLEHRLPESLWLIYLQRSCLLHFRPLNILKQSLNTRLVFVFLSQERCSRVHKKSPAGLGPGPSWSSFLCLAVPFQIPWGDHGTAGYLHLVPLNLYVAF